MSSEDGRHAWEIADTMTDCLRGTGISAGQAGKRSGSSGAGEPQWFRNQQEGEPDREADLATETAKPELKRPPLYKVILLNDDYTPMEFVVHVLEVFFAMNREKATQIMLTVHTQGSAVVGIFPRDIAETKSEQVNQYAQENQHPLISTVEMAD